MKQNSRLEERIRKIHNKILNEKTIRSHDLWNKLIDVIETHNNSGSSLSQRYSGESVFNAIQNLLNVMNIK
jgi:hypothetical protein